MSKCRYDLSEDCHNKDCLLCVLDEIREEILDIPCDPYCENSLTASAVREMVLEIIDEYKAESEGEE